MMIFKELTERDGFLKTADLFLAALFLTNQHPIAEIQVENRVKQKIVFVFCKNDKTEVLLEQFKHGIAQANVLDLKNNYQHAMMLMHENKRRWNLE